MVLLGVEKLLDMAVFDGGVLVEDRAVFDRHGFVESPLNEKNGSLLGFVDSGDRRKESFIPRSFF